jgi:hypothetical protein
MAIMKSQSRLCGDLWMRLEVSNFGSEEGKVENSIGDDDGSANMTITACQSDKKCQQYGGAPGNEKLFCLITAGYMINLF